VEAVAVLDRGDALALERAGEDRDRAPVGFERLRVGPVDGSTSWPSISIARQPKARARAAYAAVSQPSIVSPIWPRRLTSTIATRLAQAAVRGARERLPHRALGELAVAGENPRGTTNGQAPCRRRQANADGQPEAERAGGDVDPGQPRGGVALEPAAEPAVAHQLLVADRAGGAVERVKQRRGVAPGEDQMVVRRTLRVLEVVAEVAGKQTAMRSAADIPELGWPDGDGGCVHGVDASWWASSRQREASCRSIGASIPSRGTTIATRDHSRVRDDPLTIEADPHTIQSDRPVILRHEGDLL
jgi:hypothetical protein